MASKYYYVEDSETGRKVRFGGGKCQPQQTYFRSRSACEICCNHLNRTKGHVSGNDQRYRVMYYIPPELSK